MKSEFHVMKKATLENYFSNYMIPLLRSEKGLKNNKVLREELGLVLLSYLMSKFNNQRYVPALNNPDYDDGAVANTEIGKFYPVEQTYVYEGKWNNNVLGGVKDRIKSKTSKGREYSKDLWLIIYCNADGNLPLNEIREDLIGTGFTSVFLFGPSGESEFSYNVVIAKDGPVISNEIYNLTIDEKGSPTFTQL